MKAAIYRITFLLAIAFPIISISQTFPPYLFQQKGFSASHPKAANLPSSQANPVQSSPTVYPSCGFDELNHQHSLENPAFEEELRQYIEEAMPLLSQTGGLDKSAVEPLLTIAVVVHVIHNGEPIGQGQNLSEARIKAQIDILNEDYNALNSQFYNTPSQFMGVAGFPNIQFCLANKKPDGSSTNGINRQQMTVTGTSWSNNNINSTIKPAIKWDPTRYFNIYVLPIPGTTAQGGVVGYSNYPTTSQIGTNTDGVVIDYRWFGAPGYGQSGYRPLTHEAGHYLGLPHPFNGNSCSTDDGISDTPNMDGATRDYATLNCAESYPSGPVSCGNEHLYVNYMDYVTENCYTSFTAGQVNVMRAVLNGTSSGFGYGSRNGLIQNAPLQCAIPAKDAGITRIISPDNISCSSAAQISPVVTLRNFGTENLTNANILYKINNNAPISMAWTGSLFPGQNLEVSLPSFSALNGSYTITAWTTQPNGQADQRISNDTVSGNRFNYMIFPSPLFEDVEGEVGLPTQSGIFQIDFTSDGYVWKLSDEVSAFGKGTQSILFDNYNDVNNVPIEEGAYDALITRHYDFTNLQDAVLKFDVAYSPILADLGDTLLVMVSTDCTQFFDQLLFKKGGENLATAPTAFQEFTPTPTQWRTEYIDLSAYAGESDVTIAFLNISAFSNRLFLDNIGLGKNCNLMEVTSTITPDGCNTSCTGSATITATSPNGGLNYAWEGFPNSFNQSTNNQLCGGQSTVTVTDAIGCNVVENLTIGEEQAPQLSTMSTNVTSYGGSNGTATVNVANGTGPFTYAWSNGLFQPNTNNPSSTASGLAIGNYTVTVTPSNGCSTTSTVTVGSVCDGFTVNLIPVPVTCNGGNDGTVSLFVQNGTPPFTYNWNNGSSSQNLVNLPAGEFISTVTDANGCPVTASVMVEQPSIIQIMTNATNQTMLGVNDGTATATANGGLGGFTYLWSNGANTSSISNLTPGTYTVTVTDLANCTKTAIAIVNSVNCGSFAGNLGISNPPCFGQSGSATVEIAGGTMPFTYSWSNGASSQTVANLPVGAISVSVTDGLGCGLQLSGTVVAPTALLANISTTEETLAGANNGTASVSPTGGTSPYTVLWSTGANANNLTNLAPGSYGVTVTDANGCTTAGQAIVTTSDCFLALEFTSTPTTCNNSADGSIAVEVTAGGVGNFTYIWSNGQTTASINGIAGGGYQVTVTDGSGCSTVGQADLVADDNVPPVIQLVDNATASLDENGSVTLSPSYFIISANDNCGEPTLSLNPSTFSCSDIGEVQVTITAMDEGGNLASETVVLQLVDQIAPTVTCPSNIVANGCQAVQYDLPTATDNCPSAIELELLSGYEPNSIFPIGTTIVTWSAKDASGNTATCAFDVTLNYDLTAEAQIANPSCHGESDGFIALEIAGGQPPYITQWSNSGLPTNLPAGNYSATISDANGCSMVQVFSLSEPDELDIVVLSTTPATTGQSNGQIQFQVNGGTMPYQFTWLKGGVSVPDFDPQAAPAGSYQLKVVDANGCILLSGLIVVNMVSSVYDQPNLASLIQVYPNPSNGMFYLKAAGVNDSVQYSLMEATGRTIMANKMAIFDKGGNESIDLQNLPSGIYWLKIKVSENLVWKRLVKL